jgi:beta-fructofuranosidase
MHSFLLCSQLYKSTNWTTWTLGNQLVSHSGTGMWECVDFFPVAQNNLTGLPLNALAGDQTGLTYVIKSSLNDFRYVIWPSEQFGPLQQCHMVRDGSELSDCKGARR